MSERLNEYFVTEAGEYLDQLDRLLALPGAPDADSLLRLSTGIRGSAQMALAEPVAKVAEKLEDAARALLSNDLSWTHDHHLLWGRTVADLKLLVSALTRWGDEEDELARTAIERWDSRGTAGASVTSDHPGATVAAATSVASDASDATVVAATSVPSGAMASTAAVPIATLFYDDAGPHILERVSLAPPPPSKPQAVVPIGDLLLKGEAALREAMALRPTLESFARGDAVRGRALDDLVRELFELVQLGMVTESPDA